MPYFMRPKWGRRYGLMWKPLSYSVENFFQGDFFALVKGRVFDDWINGRSSGFAAGDLIENPAYIIESILREYMNYGDTEIETSSFDTLGNTTDGILKDWKFAGGIYETQNVWDVIGELLSQSKSRLFKNGENKFEISAYQSAAAVTYNYKFDKDNNITNLNIKRTSLDSIITTARVNYFKDWGSGKFNRQAFTELKKKFSGSRLTAAVTSSDTTWNVDDDTDFAVNDLVLCDDEIVLVTATATGSITVTRAEKASTAAAHSSGSNLYIITTNSYNYSTGGASGYEDSAIQSMYNYHRIGEITVNANWIYDDATAEALRDHLFNFYSRPHYVIEFDTFLNAADLKIADIIEFDDSVMDAWLKLGGESWAGKKFEVMDISRSGLIDFHVKAVEL